MKKPLMLFAVVSLLPKLLWAEEPAPAVDVVAAVEKANEALSVGAAFENLESKAGDWQVTNNQLVQSDSSAKYARTFIKGHRWMDCTIKAKIRVDSLGATNASDGVRLIFRGDETTGDFYTVGLWAGSQEVRIERSKGAAFKQEPSATYEDAFEQMKSDHHGTLAAAAYPVELGKTYEITVTVDHGAIFCSIDGKFVLLAEEVDFSKRPIGQVGFFTSNAKGSFSEVSVKGIKGITSSPVEVYPGNPLNINPVSPTIIKDEKFRVWDSMGRYAESEDGITWTRPQGFEAVTIKDNTNTWPQATDNCDPYALKIDDTYYNYFWARTARRTGLFDGVGLKRSVDGITWIPEPANPVLYMGPNGDWDDFLVGDGSVIKDGDLFKMWHVGLSRDTRGFRLELGYAESRDGIKWRKCRSNPVLTMGEKGTWDGGWAYASGVIKIDDEQVLGTHVYKGKPGASYHLFYTGQPSNNEWVSGVKRVGYAFSLDGINWVKWNDPATTEAPFHDSDPVVTYAEYGQPGHMGMGAATALLVGDEVRIYYSMYDDRPNAIRPENTYAMSGMGLATVKVADLRKIAEDAKKNGLLKEFTRDEMEKIMDEPLPQSMWDDLQGNVLLSIQANMQGDKAKAQSALAEIAATKAMFTKALERYYAVDFAPLKKVVDQLEAGHQVTEKKLWSLPADAPRTAQPFTVGRAYHPLGYQAVNVQQIEFTGLNIESGDSAVMIEFEVKCSVFDMAHVAWATEGEFKDGDRLEFIAGYPGKEYQTHRLTFDTGGKPITALRIQFPIGANVDLKTVNVRQLTITP